MAAGAEPTFFLGEYEHTLDTQRRVAIPAAWRGCSRFVLLPSRDHAIQMMSVDTFREMVLDKTRKLSLGNVEDARNLARLGSRAQECVCDKQGRILLPAVLREFAGSEKEAVLVGVGSRIEIWSRDKWTAANTFDDMEEIAEHMEGLGI